MHSIAASGDASGGALRIDAGGPASVLLSPLASEKNPSLLAGAFAKSVTSGAKGANALMPGGRKRPTAMMKRNSDGSSNNHDKSASASNTDAVKRSMEAKHATVVLKMYEKCGSRYENLSQHPR